MSEVQFTLVVTDANTAAPGFESDVYTVHVMETLPVGMVVGSLVLSASGEQRVRPPPRSGLSTVYGLPLESDEDV